MLRNKCCLNTVCDPASGQETICRNTIVVVWTCKSWALGNNWI